MQQQINRCIDEYSTKMVTLEAKAMVKKRGSIVEHPFGTIKRALGWDHFLVRTKKKVLGVKRNPNIHHYAVQKCTTL